MHVSKFQLGGGGITDVPKYHNAGILGSMLSH